MWNGYDEIDYEEFAEAEERRWEDADRHYDEMRDDAILVSSKKEAEEFVERYGEICKRYVKDWLC